MCTLFWICPTEDPAADPEDYVESTYPIWPGNILGFLMGSWSMLLGKIMCGLLIKDRSNDNHII